MTHIIIDRTSNEVPVPATTTASAFGFTASNMSVYKVGALYVSGVSPSTVTAGDTLTINGGGFGTLRGTSTVDFTDGAYSVGPTSYVSWGASQIRVTVPNLTPGNHSVTVTVGGVTSNAVTIAMDTNYYNVVTQGGLDNTGATSVTSAIGTAITTYKAGGYDGLYFPAGTYLLSTTLTVPSGTTFVGAGMASAWLQGQVFFGSTSSFTDIKIGPSSAGLAGLKNSAGASGTTFTRCHFRGGGAASTNNNSSTVNLGEGNDLSYITFTGCEFERSLGTLWTGSSDYTHRENTISLYCQGNTADHITFDDCHLGVTNGVAAGSQRMAAEVWADSGMSNLITNITFTGCEIEPTNVQGLDFSCYEDSAQMTDILIEDCLFHGGGVDLKGTAWGTGITLEWPDRVTIRDNHFHRCSNGGIYPNYWGAPLSADNHLTVTGNTFDFDTAEGGIVCSGAGQFVTHGSNGTITGNTFTYHGSNLYGCLWFQGTSATGNTVTGNTFNISTTQAIGVNWGGASGNGSPWTATNTVNRT